MLLLLLLLSLLLRQPSLLVKSALESSEALRILSDVSAPPLSFLLWVVPLLWPHAIVADSSESEEEEEEVPTTLPRPSVTNGGSGTLAVIDADEEASLTTTATASDGGDVDLTGHGKEGRALQIASTGHVGFEVVVVELVATVVGGIEVGPASVPKVAFSPPFSRELASPGVEATWAGRGAWDVAVDVLFLYVLPLVPI